jgi:23S rRNA pseudouridine2605 synthase
MRINKYLAGVLGLSRRGVEDEIRDKRVKINGTLAELFSQVEETDNVEILDEGKWKSIAKTQGDTTVLMYKPIFCVTTRQDEYDRKTIYDFLPAIYRELKPAGRLDYMSEGLLVLSNNGDHIFELTHPSNGTIKTYLVGISGQFRDQEIREMSAGIVVDDYNLNGVKVTPYTSDQYDFLGISTSLTWYLFELSEGRNNQIRKMCNYFGQKVQRLIRVKHGKYELTKELYKSKSLLTK